MTWLKKEELETLVEALRRHVPVGAVTAKTALKMMTSACGGLDSGGHPVALWKIQARLVEHRLKTISEYGGESEELAHALVAIHGAMRVWIAQLTKEELDEIGVEDHLKVMRASLARLEESKTVLSFPS